MMNPKDDNAKTPQQNGGIRASPDVVNPIGTDTEDELLEEESMDVTVVENETPKTTSTPSASNVPVQAGDPNITSNVSNQQKSTMRQQTLIAAFGNPVDPANTPQTAGSSKPEDVQPRITNVDVRNAKTILRMAASDFKKGIEPQPHFKEKLQWARDVIKQKDVITAPLTKPHTMGAWRTEVENFAKRNRSSDGESNLLKKTRESEETSGRRNLVRNQPLQLNQILKNDLKACVVDTLAPGWRVEPELLAMVETSFRDELLKTILSKSFQNVPIYNMNDRFRGFKVIACDTPQGLEFLKNVISQMKNRWPGVNLEVRLLRDLPAIPKAFIAFPIGGICENSVLPILAAQNTDIPVSRWKVANVAKGDNNRVLTTFYIDADSARILRDKRLRINYALYELNVKVTQYETVREELEAEANKTEEVADIVSKLGSQLNIDKTEESGV